MKNNFFNYSVANIYSKPSSKSEVISQILYEEKLSDVEISLVIGIGPAGTGKTLFPCQEAVDQMIKYDKKMISRFVQLSSVFSFIRIYQSTYLER